MYLLVMRYCNAISFSYLPYFQYIFSLLEIVIQDYKIIIRYSERGWERQGDGAGHIVLNVGLMDVQ